MVRNIRSHIGSAQRGVKMKRTSEIKIFILIILICLFAGFIGFRYGERAIQLKVDKFLSQYGQRFDWRYIQ
jgi:dolichol kinase